ncbi:MAG: bifunctional phosphopantothenoylcysteine decarboxylase/phosphopantothenate--cysteine ligase CoaBC [Fusobacteriaceae bacterium]|jgi:phosphopantothenoylcysteine decarboxylase/phosphopantothenate--cysteine ligase|nr:bifunctional phosphopantothenoylcysteine decarboxylase/phosphopantothenate--cysteine ligase CoaBC [Fusobacteriaceae bacterium]
MLKGKTVLLGLTGGIAAYKIASLASALVKLNAAVNVIMTENATKFIAPLTFETLTNRRCVTDTFNREFSFDVEHISLAKAADILVIAPASANTIGKLAWGMADNMLTTTALACTCPVLVVPAMNSRMYLNPVVAENMERLKKLGMELIEPASGRLACGDVGIGKMPEPETILAHILRLIAREKDLKGKKILVTAGPTREAIDPVRYITNHSTGKMGYALALAAVRRGAEVTLVSGETALAPPPFVETVTVRSAEDMFAAVTARAGDAHIVIKAAAVADYRPETEAPEKIKKSGDGITLSLVRTKDILGWLGQHKKPGQYLCGFAMETENLLENARAKLTRKNLDLIVANSLREEGAGFGGDTNIVTLVAAEGSRKLPLLSKEAVADGILDAILYGLEGKK